MLRCYRWRQNYARMHEIRYELDDSSNEFNVFETEKFSNDYDTIFMNRSFKNKYYPIEKIDVFMGQVDSWTKLTYQRLTNTDFVSIFISTG